MNDRQVLSLRTSIARRLIGGLSVICIAGAALLYATCARLANDAYDRSLLDDVQVLASHLRIAGPHVEVTLPPEALLLLVADQGEDVRYRITERATAKVLASHGSFGDAPATDRRRFRTIDVDGVALRVASLGERPDGRASPVIVEMAETMDKRHEQFRGIVFSVVATMAAVMLGAMLLVWNGLNHGVRPLRKLEVDAASRPEGDLRPLDLSAAPLEVRGLLTAINGLVDRVAASTRMERRFVANAAHQLRTPLTALKLHAQLAQEADPRGPAAEHLREIDARATHGARVVDQLLLLARAEDGAGSNDVFDAAAVGGCVIQRWIDEAHRRRIDLGLETDGRASTMRGDSTLIEELLSNLVDNALRHGGPVSRITISTRTSQDWVEIAVADDGQGVSPESRPHLFARFGRGDTAPSSGAGLGLAIVQEIAQRFGGTATLTTRPDFEGVRVSVRVPGASIP